MKHDLYSLAWLINHRELESFWYWCETKRIEIISCHFLHIFQHVFFLCENLSQVHSASIIKHWRKIALDFSDTIFTLRDDQIMKKRDDQIMKKGNLRIVWNRSWWRRRWWWRRWRRFLWWLCINSIVVQCRPCRKDQQSEQTPTKDFSDHDSGSSNYSTLSNCMRKTRGCFPFYRRKILRKSNNVLVTVFNRNIPG